MKDKELIEILERADEEGTSTAYAIMKPVFPSLIKQHAQRSEAGKQRLGYLEPFHETIIFLAENIYQKKRKKPSFEEVLEAVELMMSEESAMDNLLDDSKIRIQEIINSEERIYYIDHLGKESDIKFKTIRNYLSELKFNPD